MKAATVHTILSLTLLTSAVGLCLLNIYVQRQLDDINIYNDFYVFSEILRDSNITALVIVSIYLALLSNICLAAHPSWELIFINFLFGFLLSSLLTPIISGAIISNEFEVKVAIWRPLIAEDSLWKKIQSTYDCCGIKDYSDWNATDVQEICASHTHMKGCVQALETNFKTLFAADFAIMTIALFANAGCIIISWLLPY